MGRRSAGPGRSGSGAADPAAGWTAGVVLLLQGALQRLQSLRPSDGPRRHPSVHHAQPLQRAQREDIRGWKPDGDVHAQPMTTLHDSPAEDDRHTAVTSDLTEELHFY